MLIQPVSLPVDFSTPPSDGQALVYSAAGKAWKPVTIADPLKLPLAGGTLTGNLLFSADNARDIGASGATRPANVYVGTRLATGDGSAAAPSLAFGNSLTAGFYRVSANVIGIATSGVQRGQFGSDGVVNFSTAPPGVTNRALLNLGNGPFDGSTSGFFSGFGAGGVVLGANITSGAAFADFQISGSRRFLVENSGSFSLWRASTVQARQAVLFDASLPVTTDASRTARGMLSAVDFGGTRECLRLEANGTAACIGFLGAAAVARQSVTGSRGANAALASLLTALSTVGLITDGSS